MIVIQRLCTRAYLFAIWTHFAHSITGSEAMPFSLSAKQQRNLYRARAEVKKCHPRHGFVIPICVTASKGSCNSTTMNAHSVWLIQQHMHCNVLQIWCPKIGEISDTKLTVMDVLETVAAQFLSYPPRAMVCIDSLVWRLWALRAPKAWYSNWLFEILKINLVYVLVFHSVSAHCPISISNPIRASETGFCDVHPPDLLDIRNESGRTETPHETIQNKRFKFQSRILILNPHLLSNLPPGNPMGWILCWLGKLNNDDESLALPEFEVRYSRPRKET